MEDKHIKHLTVPGYENRRHAVILGESVSAFLERAEWQFKLPTICVYNGQPLMRKDWETTTISAPDNIVFYSKPHGGGGNSGNKARTVLSLVAMVALAAFAPYIAGPAMLALSGFAYYATVSAITLAGGFLISSFLSPKPASNDDEPVAQLYSLTASGNVAQPFQTIPVQYGRLKIEPPYATIPWSDYIGNDAYLNILLANGQGKYDVEQLLIDDSLLWDSTSGLSGNFTNVELQFCDPGESFTLFPANVVETSEVNGQELSTTPIGFFIANASGTTAYKYYLDYVFPEGLQFTDASDGRKYSLTVTIKAEIQRVDNAGTPIGSPVLAVNTIITWNTSQPQRVSQLVDLAALGLPNGRYQFRTWREPFNTSDDDRAADMILWGNLRSYLVGPNTFENTSVIGIRIKATAQLSQNSAKKFGVIQTRILPVWNGSTFVEEPTQNAWWAFYDAATNAIYGANWPLNKIDFQTIVEQATAADVRGDTFNYVFGSAVTYQQAFDLILMSSRAKVTWLGDVLSATRDEWKPIPQMLISDQQIIRGSIEVDYVLNDEESTDSIRGQFLNEDTWQPAELQYPPNSGSFTSERPGSIQIDGVTNSDQMFAELRFWYKQSQLRRIKVRLDTEHDGRLLRFGSTVKVQSHLPKKWGASGEVKAYNAGTRVMTLDRTLTPEVGNHYIELRDKRGRYFGPVLATLGSPQNLVTLDAADLAAVEADIGMTVAQALDRMDGAEPPAFVWGLSANLSRNCIVLSGKPTGHKVSLEMVVDREEVHDATGDDIPVLPSVPSIQDPRVPLVSGLVANFKQGMVEPTLTATWWPSKGALYYKAQVSYDSGATWTTLKDGFPDPQLQEVVSYANLRLRVAAIGQLQGPYSVVDVVAPDITVVFPVGPDNLTEGLRDYVMVQLSTSAEETAKVLQQIANIAAEADAGATRNLVNVTSQTTSLRAEVNVNATAFTDFQVAYAAYQVEVAASFGDIEASVTTNAEAIADVEGNLAASYTLTLDVNGYVSGFQSTNTGASATFAVLADYFYIAKPGVTGGSAVPVFSIQTVGGVPKLAFRGDMFADGSINAVAVNAVTLSALSANLGTVITGRIESSDGKFLIDATNRRIVISE